MSSRRGIGRVLVWARTILLCLILFVLSLYVLLATGLLGDAPGRIAGALASTDSVTVTFRGLRTDLFWGTSADSVIVTGVDGLVVSVAGADIQGSLVDYFLSGHVRLVKVESLYIGIPPATDDGSPPEPLETILDNIDQGIAVSTDLLLLEYGRIEDAGTVILDSMYLRCSVDRLAGVMLQVDSAGIVFPGFGKLGGNGQLNMAGGIVSTGGFDLEAAPGSLGLSGTLNGTDEYLNVDISGSVSTSGLDLPVEISADIGGNLSGNLSSLQAALGVSNGTAVLNGRTVEFTVDTLRAGLDSLSVDDLSMVTDGLSLLLDGRLDISSMYWSASVHAGMYALDVSTYLETALPTELTGTVTAELEGTADGFNGARATVDLARSKVSVATIQALHLDGSIYGSDASLSGSITAGGGTVSFEGSSRLGHDMIPESWDLAAEGSIGDLTFIRRVFSADIPSISSAWFSFSGRGTRFGMNLDGSVRVRDLEVDSLRAETAVLNGSLSYALGRGSSSASTVGFRGDGQITGFSTDGVAVDTLRVTGRYDSSLRTRSAEADISMDSLRFASQALSLSASAELDNDALTVHDLVVTGSGDRQYTADVSLTIGDTISLDLSDLRASHSKLRLINDGSLSVSFAKDLILVDTLWIDPPVGRLGFSGTISPDSLEMRADIENLDLTSLSAIAGLPADLSGVGNFSVVYSRDAAGVAGSLTGRIVSPAYGQFSMDSITVDISAEDNVLQVNGIYAWHDQVRSGLQLRARDAWTGTEISLLSDKIEWLELEVNDISDWLFYVLPLPVRTMGASVSARIEYQRNGTDYDLQMQASARIQRLFITILGVELPNVNFYLSYPDSSARNYNTRFTIGSGSTETGNFSSTWRADIRSIFPFSIGDYVLDARLTDMEIAIPGIGAVICSGELVSSGSGMDERPMLSGKIRVQEGAVGIPQPVTASSGGGSGEMPFDLSIDVAGTGGIWFRTSFADIEMSLKLRIFTLERKPTVNGTVSAVRGRITLLQRDFQITTGTVTIIQGHPITTQLNVEAVTRVRSSISHQEYEITVLIHGNAENPEITLTGIGPAGQISQEDILTLLAAGVTYGEMQQLNSSAIRSEVENMAQSMLGSLLARNIRHEIGLDTFEISPELLSDTTSLVLNVGKYVLPDLYVSYKDDVFSGDPGTVSAQYLFSSDFYVEGSSRTTIHGYLEPTIELHYTIRY